MPRGYELEDFLTPRDASEGRKRPHCTGSRLVVYNQQTRGMSGRRTMAV